MAEWQTIDTAPKDGTWILAYGLAYPDYAERGHWLAHAPNKPRVPYITVVRWVEGWYDKEIEVGEGLYRKESTLAYAHWNPEPLAFQPTHWIPLPEPPRS